MAFVICDIATAPLENAAELLPDIKPPSNYTKAESIEKFVAEKREELIARAGLDPDLCRITAIGCATGDGVVSVRLCQSAEEEYRTLEQFRSVVLEGALIGFNSLRFDWPVLNRRAMYLGVKLNISCERYRNSNVDLSEVLTQRGTLTARSLNFYIKRLGWTDLLDKPLSGEAEAQVFESGKWDELAASVRRDVTATYRLAKFCGVIP